MDRSPFKIQNMHEQAPTDAEMAALDAHIPRAECGDAESQYWLAASLQNGFNAAPDEVEIYKWYRLAELGDSEPARERLASFDATMPAPLRA